MQDNQESAPVEETAQEAVVFKNKFGDSINFL